MGRIFFKHSYFSTYYFSNIVSNLIEDRWNYLGVNSQFFENNGFINVIEPWQKKSAIHKYIEFVLIMTIEDESYDSAVEQLNNQKNRNDSELEQLQIEWLLSEFKIDYLPFKEFCPKPLKNITEDDFYDYFNELTITSDLENLYERIAEEVFHVIFSNRKFLLLFNNFISDYIADVNIDYIIEEDLQEFTKYFIKDGKLKRVNIPKWVKDAVSFRDRGKCCLCHKDLSNLISSSELEYDHIVPLQFGGINDVSNIQLLCKECNKNKGGGKIATSDYYEKWY